MREVFAQRAEHLGYRIVESRAAFPDYLLEHEGQRIFAEAEFRTSDFLRHRHDLSRCDLIVVWEHDMPAMPTPVLELKTNGLHITKRRGRPPGVRSPGQQRWRRAFWARKRAVAPSTNADPLDQASNSQPNRSEPK